MSLDLVTVKLSSHWVTFSKLYEELREKIQFIYCPLGDHFYRPQIGQYEEFCPICKRVCYFGGMAESVLVLMEDEN